MRLSLVLLVFAGLAGCAPSQVLRTAERPLRQAPLKDELVLAPIARLPGVTLDELSIGELAVNFRRELGDSGVGWAVWERQPAENTQARRLLLSYRLDVSSRTTRNTAGAIALLSTSWLIIPALFGRLVHGFSDHQELLVDLRVYDVTGRTPSSVREHGQFVPAYDTSDLQPVAHDFFLLTVDSGISNNGEADRRAWKTAVMADFARQLAAKSIPLLRSAAGAIPAPESGG
jgi:hypothetical protein